VSDVTVRAPSIDVRTVGAGGGSIAYVPDLTKALRVGPQSAGASPGPAAYMKGGDTPTVTDANVVLGYLPTRSRLGGDMKIDRELALRAVSSIAQALDKTPEQAAEGVINIVNENMFGALRLVSIEQGYDPRDFALVAFGGAGPLHANALGKLMGSWPVIIPPAPGVLCAYGDATTRVRDEASRTFIRRVDETSDAEVRQQLEELAALAGRSLVDEGVPAVEQHAGYQIDVRYRGQGMRLTLSVSPDVLAAEGLAGVTRRFDEMHTQLYTFALDAPHELVNLRAIVEGPETLVKADPLASAGPDPSEAEIDRSELFFEGRSLPAVIYDRRLLKAGHRVPGPAIVCQMDTTTLILPGHTGEIDRIGNILIRPNA
jgi:N-methylhydantoinase A